MKTFMILVLVVGCGNTREGDLPDAPVDAGELAPDAPGRHDSDVTQSGSRVKMNVLTTPDGAKQFVSWRDTLRNEDCSFRLAADSATRCLPFVYTTAFNYADSTCTIPVVQALSCGLPPSYVAIPPVPNGCTASPLIIGPRIFTRGQQYATAYRKFNEFDACNPVIGDTAFVYYAAGVEVLPSEFQSATLAVE